MLGNIFVRKGKLKLNTQHMNEKCYRRFSPTICLSVCMLNVHMRIRRTNGAMTKIKKYCLQYIKISRVKEKRLGDPHLMM